MSIAVLVCLFTVLFLPVWPMQYQVFFSERSDGMSHGFRGRKWLIGQWAAIGQGKGSEKEAKAWMALQAKTTYLFGAIPARKASR